MAKRKTTKATPPADHTMVKLEYPEMTEEWQVTPGDTKTCHVFTSRGAVFGFLASEWQRFVMSAADGRTCALHVDVRHVMREKHHAYSK